MNRWTSVLLAVGGLIAFPLVDSAIKGTLILVLAAAVCLWEVQQTQHCDFKMAQTS